MKTAIALFGERVSPRFDCAQDFMVINVNHGRITKRQREKIRDWMSIVKVKRLADLDVETLICGGVDEKSVEYLRFMGIRVVANVKGGAEDAVSSFLDGGLLPI